MNRKIIGWIAGGIVLVGIVAVSLIMLSFEEGNGDVIMIGAILPMTGEVGFLGQGNRESLLLYAEQNPDVKFIFEDSKGTPKDGLNAANKLIAQNVRYFITSLSYIVNTIQPALDEKQVLNITLSMDPRAERQSKYCMRLYVTMYQEMDALAQLAREQGVKQIAVLYNNAESLNNAVENYLKSLLDQAGIALYTESYNFGTKDFRNIIAKISDQKPEMVRILDFGDKLQVILNQISESGGFPDTIIVSGLETLMIDYNQVPPDIVSRYRFTLPRFLFNSDNAVVREYNRKYGKKPSFDAVFSYDIAQLLVPEIRKNGYANVDQVIESIIDRKQFAGAAAVYSIDEYGGVGPRIEWARIKEGQIVFVE